MSNMREALGFDTNRHAVGGHGCEDTHPQSAGSFTTVRGEPHEPIPMTGRIKCVASQTDADRNLVKETIHWSNDAQTKTLCGREIVGLRPFLRGVTWGHSDLLWCDRCEKKVLSE